ncbi:hypothetical protein A2U01_0045835, partial [Trifolium medium]|nr:hypothetical protein [Trifolium medium]
MVLSYVLRSVVGAVVGDGLVASFVPVDSDCLARNDLITCCLSESLVFDFVIVLAVGVIVILK